MPDWRSEFTSDLGGATRNYYRYEKVLDLFSRTFSLYHLSKIQFESGRAQRVQMLNRTASETIVKVLENLYKMPIAGIADIVKWTGYTERGGYKVIERLVVMGILSPMKTGENVYAQKWVYGDYLTLFDGNS